MATESDMDLDEIQRSIDRQFPVRDGLAIVAGSVWDRRSELFPQERAVLAKAVEKRKHEFATGRALAREAMLEIDAAAAPVLRGDNREPVWPEGVTGSITHTTKIAVAAVARDSALRSIGIDLEIADRVDEPLFGKLFTENELAGIATGDRCLPGLLFAAKEAVYKATYPLAGRFIGFKEAEVTVDWEQGSLAFGYLGDHLPSRVMEAAEGHFLVQAGYVLALVIIPRRRGEG